MSSADEVREGQRATWAGLSAGWGKWDAIIMRQLAPVGEAMIARLQIGVDQQHLDVACGTGEPGLTIARLAPQGRVVLTDLAAEMLDVAVRRAAEQGIANIETVPCSADDLPFENESFDSVSIRFGYMFFPDADVATAELTRVLHPGGRIAASVWIQPEANRWTSIAMQAIATEVDVPAPHPDAPGMYRYSAPGCIEAVFERAGLRDIEECSVPVELVTDSPELYWEVMSEHVSPAVTALQRVDSAARERIRAIAIDRVRAYECDGEIRVPGMARVIVGTK